MERTKSMVGVACVSMWLLEMGKSDFQKNQIQGFQEGSIIKAVNGWGRVVTGPSVEEETT